MRTRFTGCGTALVTPFTSEGALDEAATRRLARRQVEAGVHFLVPCGTTGETPTLDAAERRRIVEIVLEEASGHVPVLAGAGGYDTREVVAAARELHAMGVDGVLSVTPYYNKPTPEGLYQHYAAISDAAPLPIVVYNVPGRTACNIEPATLARLATIPNVIGVKEASGNMAQICEARQAVPGDFLVLAGDDVMCVPVMAIGGQGVISVASNEVPGEMAGLVEACERGDYADARGRLARLLPLLQVNFIESNPIPVKWAMSHMGLLGPHYRLPMVAPRPASQARIAHVLRDLGLPPAGVG